VKCLYSGGYLSKTTQNNILDRLGGNQAWK
jgi:hypothetical protein